MINRVQFFGSVRASLLFHGTLDQSQVNGMNILLDCWEKNLPKGDSRWVACILANSYHETDQAMQPVRERGLGRGHAYGLPAGPWHQIYYGRGLVQDTWERNYAFAQKRLQELGLLSAGEDLVKDPDLMLRPDISAVTIIWGMVEGWFTGRKLANYFNGVTSDWLNSRRIINGLDCAASVATYGQTFFAALR